jgi:hypothetical protein
MRRLNKDYGKIKPVCVSRNLINMCLTCPDVVSVESALAQFRWVVANGGKGTEDYEVLKTFLSEFIAESTMLELEVLYEQCP